MLARLENYQHHRGLPPVCVVCECQRNVQAAGKAKSALMALDSGDSDTDTDDEGEMSETLIVIIQVGIRMLLSLLI